MNKQEAAEFLGVSVRALERYVQQGKISVTYLKGKTRPTAHFDPGELERFKEELNQPTTKPAFEPRQTPTEQQPPTGQLVHHPGEFGEIDEFSDVGAIDKMAAIIESLIASKVETLPKVPTADKLLLTIEEVQLLTGLSRENIKGAIASSGSFGASQLENYQQK